MRSYTWKETRDAYGVKSYMCCVIEPKGGTFAYAYLREASPGSWWCDIPYAKLTVEAGTCMAESMNEAGKVLDALLYDPAPEYPGLTAHPNYPGLKDK